MANKHQSENICNICSKELGTKYNLKRHIKKVHTNIVKFGGNKNKLLNLTNSHITVNTVQKHI